MVTDNLIVTTKNYFRKKYQEKGFLNTKVSLDTKADTSNVNSVNMLIHIDKGDKVKIKDITFDGNEELKDKKLKKALKNTKKSYDRSFLESFKIY